MDVIRDGSSGFTHHFDVMVEHVVEQLGSGAGMMVVKRSPVRLTPLMTLPSIRTSRICSWVTFSRSWNSPAGDWWYRWG